MKPDTAYQSGRAASIIRLSFILGPPVIAFTSIPSRAPSPQSGHTRNLLGACSCSPEFATVHRLVRLRNWTLQDNATVCERILDGEFLPARRYIIQLLKVAFMMAQKGRESRGKTTAGRTRPSCLPVSRGQTPALKCKEGAH